MAENQGGSAYPRRRRMSSSSSATEPSSPMPGTFRSLGSGRRPSDGGSPWSRGRDSPGATGAGGGIVPDQLYSTEPISAMAAVEGVVLNTALKITDKWKTDWNRPLQVPTNNALTTTRPVPGTSTRFKNPRHRFIRPPTLISSNQPTKQERDAAVEYMLDSKDMQWLLKFNTDNKDASLSPAEFEKTIDRLEKDSFYHLNTHKLVLESPASRKRRRQQQQQHHNHQQQMQIQQQQLQKQQQLQQMQQMQQMQQQQQQQQQIQQQQQMQQQQMQMQIQHQGQMQSSANQHSQLTQEQQAFLAEIPASPNTPIPMLADHLRSQHATTSGDGAGPAEETGTTALLPAPEIETGFQFGDAVESAPKRSKTSRTNEASDPLLDHAAGSLFDIPPADSFADFAIIPPPMGVEDGGAIPPVDASSFGGGAPLVGGAGGFAVPPPVDIIPFAGASAGAIPAPDPSSQPGTAILGGNVGGGSADGSAGGGSGGGAGGAAPAVSARKPPQRKMKIPLVLLVACVASLQAASLMDSVFGEQCPPQCCPTAEPATTDPATTDPATTDPATTDPATTKTADTKEDTTADPTEPTTTADICSTCDISTCDAEGGAGSASLSLLALLLPAVFARLL